MAFLRKLVASASPIKPKQLRAFFHRLSRRRKVYVVNRHRSIVCCTMRNDDLYRLEEYFRANGAILVDDPDIADIFLINTCAFDKEREELCLKLIEEFARRGRQLMVTGCVGKINGPATERVIGKGIYIPPFELCSKLDKDFGEVAVPFSTIVFHGRETNLYDGGVGWRSRTRPEVVPLAGAVRVVNGCRQKCSYCTHRLSIGQRPVSVAFEHILTSVRTQVDKGAQVVQLLADNLGPYGADIRSSIPKLIANLHREFPSLQYALDQYHAAYFVRDYRKGLKEAIDKHLIYEIKMPVQSGCDRILREMKRKTNLDQLRDYVRESVAIAPDMLWVTHIITGFPSETEEEFQETVEYVSEVFDHNSLVYVFPCSVHPDTPAANIRPLVSPSEAIRRAVKAEKTFTERGIDVCLDHLTILNARGLFLDGKPLS